MAVRHPLVLKVVCLCKHLINSYLNIREGSGTVQTHGGNNRDTSAVYHGVAGRAAVPFFSHDQSCSMNNVLPLFISRAVTDSGYS